MTDLVCSSVLDVCPTQLITTDHPRVQKFIDKAREVVTDHKEGSLPETPATLRLLDELDEEGV